MSENLQKIDKFYLVLGFVLLLMAVLVIFTFRGIFSSYLIAYELNQKDFGNETKVDKIKLDEAYSWAFNKTTLPLEVR